MSGVNKAIIIGRLGRDPDLRQTQSGTAVCNFSVATDRKWNDKQSGEKREETEWHRVVAFGRTAEVCSQHIGKGSQVYVEGRLKTSSYEKDGVKKYSTEIVADIVQFLGSKNDGGQGGNQGGGGGGGYGGGGYQNNGQSGGGQGGQSGNSGQSSGNQGGPPPYNPGSYAPTGPEDDDIPF